MPFNIKICKIQGGAIHDLKCLRCVVYFQGFENLAKETNLAERKGICFCGFGSELTFEKIPTAGPLGVRSQAIVIEVKSSDGTSIGQTRIHLSDFGLKVKRKLTKLSRPRKCNVQISFEFYRNDDGARPHSDLVSETLKRSFGNQPWIQSMFLQCGKHVLPTEERLLYRVDDVAIVYGSGASASDHEFPGELWLTSSRLLFFPDMLFSTHPSTSSPPFSFPFQLSLSGVKKITIEREFECCSCLTSSNSSSSGSTFVRKNQLGTIAGYCRARIWGKLPRFCELRAPGDCVHHLELVRSEILWRCAEASFSDIVDHTKEDNWGPIDLVSVRDVSLSLLSLHNTTSERTIQHRYASMPEWVRSIPH